MDYKIVSIVAYDRSGTTFLGNLLHNYKNIFNVGELDRGFKKLVGERHKICSCGSTIEECPIWGKIDQKFLIEQKENNKKVYDWLARETNSKILIDTSKGFQQIKFANSHKQDKQLIIHLVRSPKGVIYSRMKTRKRRVANKTHPKMNIAKHYNLLMIYDAFEWCLENLWIERFKKRKKNVITVFYEDLENDYYQKILPFLINAGMNEEKSELKTPHILAGNINRYKPVKEIKIDNQWKQGLNSMQKLIVDFITFPVRLSFNYKFK